MDRSLIDTTLTEIEDAFASDPDASLSGRQFWKAAGATKRDPELVKSFADRIAALDHEGFSRWAFLKIPLGIGTALALAGTAVGVALVGLAYSAAEPWNGISLLVGMFVLFTTLHSLAHLVIGRMFGIRFTHWFVGTIGRPQPGVKIDYATYLRTPAAQRAWMHAAGAMMSKAVPFLLIPAALAADVPAWALWALVGIGGVTITTDSLLSVKTGDWKKFKREMALRDNR